MGDAVQRLRVDVEQVLRGVRRELIGDRVRDSEDLDLPRLMTNSEQHHEGAQSAERPDFDVQEVGCGETGGVGLQERRPRRLAIGRRRHSITLEEAARSLSRTQASEARVALRLPRDLFPSHTLVRDRVASPCDEIL